MKRVFGKVEAVFDILYLGTALILGAVLLFTSTDNLARMLAGIMAIILAFGDAFHLVPRIRVIFTGEEEKLRKALGFGKLITSITMAVFYLILWEIALLVFTVENASIWSVIIYILTAVRIILCLLPQNKWQERFPPVNFGIYRNIPFFITGLIVAFTYFINRSVDSLQMVWLAVTLSFLFYLPVVLWANKNRKIGMLMLPKSCAYIWILIICLSL